MINVCHFSFSSLHFFFHFCLSFFVELVYKVKPIHSTWSSRLHICLSVSPSNCLCNHDTYVYPTCVVANDLPRFLMIIDIDRFPYSSDQLSKRVKKLIAKNLSFLVRGKSICFFLLSFDNFSTIMTKDPILRWSFFLSFLFDLLTIFSSFFRAGDLPTTITDRILAVESSFRFYSSNKKLHFLKINSHVNLIN